MLKDIGDWEYAIGIRIKFPPTGHPVNSVKVMRACLLLEPQGKLVPFARRCFQAYFGEGSSHSPMTLSSLIFAETPGSIQNGSSPQLPNRV